jgi:hypothetical protein
LLQRPSWSPLCQRSVRSSMVLRNARLCEENARLCALPPRHGPRMHLGSIRILAHDSSDWVWRNVRMRTTNASPITLWAPLGRCAEVGTLVFRMVLCRHCDPPPRSSLLEVVFSVAKRMNVFCFASQGGCKPNALL